MELPLATPQFKKKKVVDEKRKNTLVRKTDVLFLYTVVDDD